MRVADCKKLRVHRLALDAAMEIFELTKRFPPEERFSLTDQLRRSGRSVVVHIAEAWRKRCCEAAFLSGPRDGDAGAAETKVHPGRALRRGYRDAATRAKLWGHQAPICRRSTNLVYHASLRCSAHHAHRELPPGGRVAASESGNAEPFPSRALRDPDPPHHGTSDAQS